MNDTSHYLILIGLPASGKSTVAPLLAKRLGWDWKDTDACLEVWWQVNHGDFISTRDLYRKIGEAGFRAIERRAIQQIRCSGYTVIATGGGTLIDEETAQFLKSRGRFVYLRQSVETTKARLANKAAFSLASLDDRLSIYSRFADYVIEAETLTPDEIVEAILEAYGQ